MSTFKCQNCGEISANKWIGFSALRIDGEVFKLCWKCAQSLDRSEKFELMRRFAEQVTLQNNQEGKE